MTKRQIAEQLVDRPGGQVFGLISREQAIKNLMGLPKATLVEKLARPVSRPNAHSLSY